MIVTGATIQEICTTRRTERGRIVQPVAEQQIVARSAEQFIRAITAVQRIGIIAAIEYVNSLVAK